VAWYNIAVISVAINGFGRIGRAFCKLALGRDDIVVRAINDLGDPEQLAYLFRFDSVYGRFSDKIKIENENKRMWLIIGDPDNGGHRIMMLQEKDPANLPWEVLDIDVVVEATGAFESFESARVHQTIGAKRVVLASPATDEDGSDTRTVLVGVNSDDLKECIISSNGSCTTNSVAPVMQILQEELGIKKAFLNTVHGYTATQNLIDGPSFAKASEGKSHDFRRGRAAAANIVPSTTGAAVSVTRAISDLESKFDGVAMRVPVLTGSISSVVFVSKKKTSVEEINSILEKAANAPRWKGILSVTREPIVSSDIVGDPHAAIADLSLTKVVDGDLCAVYSWYDNEFGYANTLLWHVIKAGATIRRPA